MAECVCALTQLPGRGRCTAGAGSGAGGTSSGVPTILWESWQIRTTQLHLLPDFLAEPGGQILNLTDRLEYHGIAERRQPPSGLRLSEYGLPHSVTGKGPSRTDVVEAATTRKLTRQKLRAA
jgi:hypothetical protein